jgi:hypothetical protein
MKGVPAVAVNRGRFFAVPETLDMDRATARLRGSELGDEHRHQSTNEQEQCIGKCGSYAFILEAHVTPGEET